MKYIEIGIGNKNFISSEIESGQSEYRIKGTIKLNVISFYIRIQLIYKVIIFDTKDFLIVKRKNYKKFKLLFGIMGN